MNQSGSNPPNSVLLELCAGGIEDVRLGSRRHVERIELNCGMALDGLTPSAGLVAAARREFSGTIIAMVRPREGGFLYSTCEFHQMLDDCEFLLACGLDGLAVGVLHEDGTIDQKRCHQLRMLFPAATLVFHKAFDMSSDLHLSLHQLIDCGFQRILTSGGRQTALQGAQTLRELLAEADGRIELLAGGGIRASNALELLTASHCRQIHSSVRSVTEDPSVNHSAEFREAESAGLRNGSFGQASETQLAELQKVIAAFCAPGTSQAIG